jgi:protein-tyrosine-phosphatase
MAAGIARNVFGSTHAIASAGAETAAGHPAAGNAIKAMAEFDVDISDHETMDVADLDLSSYDLIVVFRPSAAESIRFPAASLIEYLDIPDPYGEPLDTYRRTVRAIRRGVRALYARDARRRLAGGATGSHVAGVFNRAAKEFEKEVSEFVTRKFGTSMPKKATLGQLGKDIEKYSIEHNSSALMDLATLISNINDNWVKVKHREDPAAAHLIAGLDQIQRGFQLLAAPNPVSCHPVESQGGDARK